MTDVTVPALIDEKIGDLINYMILLEGLLRRTLRNNMLAGDMDPVEDTK